MRFLRDATSMLTQRRKEQEVVPRISRFCNGLMVASDFMPQAKSISVALWVSAGSRHERESESGIAHFLEHMVFKGAGTRSAQEIAVAIESVGGQLNAWTGRETTVFCAQILPDHLSLAVDLLTDLAAFPHFRESDIALERPVVLQEIAQANDTPDDFVFDALQEVAWPQQPLGRPILGSAQTVGLFSRDMLERFRRRKYVASRMVLSAAGQVRHTQLLHVARRLADLPERNPEPDAVASTKKCYRIFPSQSTHADSAASAGRVGFSNRLRYVGGRKIISRSSEQVHLATGFRSTGYHDKNHYKWSLFSAILGEGTASPLFQEIREKRGLAYAVYSFHEPLSDVGIFGIYAGVAPDKVVQTCKIVRAQLEAHAKHIPSTGFLRAKAQLRAGLLMGSESNTSRCSCLAKQLLLFGRPIPVAEILSEIESIEESHLCALAEQCLQTPSCLAAVGPIRAAREATDFLEARSDALR